MERVGLLEEARRAGLDVTVDGDQLVVRGPRSAERLAVRLIERKAEILPLLRLQQRETIPKPAPGEVIILDPTHPAAHMAWGDYSSVWLADLVPRDR